MRRKEYKEPLEPKCPSCRGYIATKINGNTRFPYQCMGCGIEFQTLPPVTESPAFEFFKKLFKFGRIAE